MDSDELGNDLVRLDNGYLVEDETYVVNSDDVLEQEENNSDSNGGKNVPLREQDRFLPIANIAKIMKRAIPENGKIAKDARECVQECISEFISFVTSEAADRCQVEKRKTINGEDVLYALNTLGFDNYVEPLKLYLKKYRELLLNPVTMNKLQHDNKSIILYEGRLPSDPEPTNANPSGMASSYSDEIPIPQEIESVQDHSEGEIEMGTETAVIYTYPKEMNEFIG